MLMYRLPVIAILLAAAVFVASLEGQVHAIQRPRVPARTSVGPSSRFARPGPRFGAVSTHRFPRQPVLVGRRPLRRHLSSPIFFGTSELGEQESFTAEELAESPSEERAEELTEQQLGGTGFLPYSMYVAPYYTEPYSQVAEQTQATIGDPGGDLLREVDRLRDEVGRLREEQVSREQARQAALQPRTLVEEKAPTTILVFRDARRSEIQNYAIVGQTLWAFTDQRAHKMPVADLDLEATKNVNEERGVEFRIP